VAFGASLFKTLVLSALYNLSDDQIEYQVRDRLSFMRFLGLGLGDRVPDAKTVWLYREALAKAGKVEEVFGLFDGHLARQVYIARGGQIRMRRLRPIDFPLAGRWPCCVRRDIGSSSGTT
jgi:IS5 family transposase